MNFVAVSIKFFVFRAQILIRVSLLKLLVDKLGLHELLIESRVLSQKIALLDFFDIVGEDPRCLLELCTLALPLFHWFRNLFEAAQLLAELIEVKAHLIFLSSSLFSFEPIFSLYKLL